MSENSRLLEALVQHKAAVEWFKGLFKVAHLEITDTGEKFTILHNGDTATISSGFSREHPNFVIPLQSDNIQRLSATFAEQEVSAFQEYRIVKFMLKPCIRASLEMPILKNPAVLRIAKVETHWQEAVLDPDGNEDEQVTVLFVNKQWLLIPGYHGIPQRRVILRPKQLLDFQRRILEADAAGSTASWVKLARWYVKWREEITVRV